MPWQCLQILVLLGFVLLSTYLEQRLLARLMPQSPASSLLETQFALREQSPAWFPDGFWRLGWPLAIAGMGLLLFTRWRWYLIALLGMASSLMLTADRIYNDFFASIISVPVLKAAPQLWAVRDSVFASLHASDGLFPLLFLGFGLFGFFWNRRVSTRLAQNPRMFLSDKVLGLVFLVAAVWSMSIAFTIPARHHGSPAEAPGSPIAIQDFVPNYLSSRKDFATHFGVYNFHLWDVVQALFGGGKGSLNDQGRTLIAHVLDEKKARNDLPSPFQGVAQGRNVVVISMEAFQHLLLDLHVDGVEVTPVMNRIAGQSLRWDYVVDNAGLGGTSDAEFSVLTGLLPDTRDIASLNLPTRNRLLGLPKLLKAQSYHTASFHGNDPSFWNRDVNHPRLGFEKLYFRSSFQAQKIGLGIPDQPFFEQSAAILSQAPEPFFAFLISLTSHHPYQFLPPGLALPAWNLPPGSMAARYLASCRYADRALGRFFAVVKEQGLWERTIFIIYGDHIPPLPRAAATMIGAHTGIDPGALRHQRIPFLIFMPGLETLVAEQGGTYRRVIGGLQDLLPTVLHLLGYEIPRGIYGTHLFVDNSTRGVVPFLKGGSNFIHHGILYDSQSLSPITDQQGMVFMENEPEVTLPNREALQKHYLRAGLDILVHRLIFDHDAQDVSPGQ